MAILGLWRHRPAIMPFEPFTGSPVARVVAPATVPPGSQPADLAAINRPVVAMTADEQGHIWVGTQTGLYRFVGDRSTRFDRRDGLPGVAMDVSEAGMRFMASRVGQAMPIGNEGCGIVVAAGASEAAQALVGKTVALIGGEIYAEYRCLAAMACMPLPDGTAPEDGASCFVNPLTSLGFTETMKLEGYKGIVHAAAASNLGQMLVKICKADGIPLINIVRNPAQVDLPKGIGAKIVPDSLTPRRLMSATRATIPIASGTASGRNPSLSDESASIPAATETETVRT